MFKKKEYEKYISILHFKSNNKVITNGFWPQFNHVSQILVELPMWNRLTSENKNIKTELGSELNFQLWYPTGCV